jgi:hypothetical protein
MCRPGRVRTENRGKGSPGQTHRRKLGEVEKRGERLPENSKAMVAQAPAVSRVVAVRFMINSPVAMGVGDTDVPRRTVSRSLPHAALIGAPDLVT